MPESPPLQAIGGPAAWRGTSIDWKSECLHVLQAAEIEEIDRALQHLHSLGDLDLPDITKASFPLHATVRTLAKVRDSLWRGRGFAMLRGLPRERYSADDMARIYFGLGAYLGQPMVQSYLGEVLGHVMDHSDLEAQPRGYHAGGHMGMHTDSCDIVGLMCLRTARSGGASRIASAVAVHDALLASRSDVLETLFRGFFYRRMDADAVFGSGSVLSRQRVPVFAPAPQAPSPLTCYFLGGYARRAAARGDASLSGAELEAIECVERLAESPDFHLDMNFAEGDIQFLNNRLVLHGRTDYEDAPAISERRHLLRLWLAVPDWPPLPDAQVFHTAEDRASWARQRTARMEMPSAYVAALERRRAQQRPLAQGA
jgi:hypothetical protein